MRRFCYVCGALEDEGAPLIQGLCQQCFVKENRLLKVPQKLVLITCKRCGAHLFEGRWREEGRKDALRSSVISNVRVARLTRAGMGFFHPLEVPDVEISVHEKPDGVVEIEARGKISELQIEPQIDKAQTKLVVSYKTCDVCSLKRSGYHEAILQVRGKVPKERLFEIREALERLVSRAGRKSFISSIQERHEGLDFHVNPLSMARRMASMLKSEFGARLEESAKLVGRTRDGRPRYRVSILARVGEELKPSKTKPTNF